LTVFGVKVFGVKAFGLEIDEEVVEPIEPLVPELFELTRPVVDRTECGTVDAVGPVTSGRPTPDEPDVAQHLQVLGDLRLREAEPVDQFTDGRFAPAECAQDSPPTAVADRIEHISRRRTPRHTAHHIPIMVYVKRWRSRFVLEDLGETVEEPPVLVGDLTGQRTTKAESFDQFDRRPGELQRAAGCLPRADDH